MITVMMFITFATVSFLEIQTGVSFANPCDSDVLLYSHICWTFYVVPFLIKITMFIGFIIPS